MKAAQFCLLFFATLSAWSQDQPQTAAWSVAREDAALTKIRSLVRDDHLTPAREIARKTMQEGAGKLQHLNTWQRLIGALATGSRVPKDTPRQSLYRAEASAVLGMKQLAIDCYYKAVTQGSYSPSTRATHARRAAFLAAEIEDYERAIELFGLMAKHGNQWQKEFAEKHIELLKPVVAKPDEPEIRIALACDFWAGKHSGEAPRYQIAIRILENTLAAENKITPNSRKTIDQQLSSFYLLLGNLSSARMWAEKLAHDFPAEKELYAQTLLNTGQAFLDTDKTNEAEEVFSVLTKKYQNTSVEVQACYRLGLTLMRKNEFKKAIDILTRIVEGQISGLTATKTMMRPDLQHDSCRRLAECYEALLDFKNALKYERLALTKYSCDMGCGTCSMSIELKIQAHISFLEHMTKLKEKNNRTISTAAGRLLRRGNMTAGATLQRMGRTAVPEIIPLLDHKKGEIRSTALKLLIAIGPQAIDVPVLAKLLDDSWSATRISTAEALGELGPAARPAIPALLAAMNKVERITFGESIRKIGCTTNEIPELKKALSIHRDRKALEVIAEQLAELKGEAAPAIPEMARLIESGCPGSIFACWAFPAIGSETVPHVIRLVKKGNSNIQIRNALADTLIKLGPVAGKHIPALEEMAQDRKYSWMASRALAGVGPSALPILFKLAENNDHVVATSTLKAFGHMEESAKTVVPFLIQKTDKRNKNGIRKQAILSLGKLAQHSQAALPIIVEELNATCHSTKSAAVEALGNFKGNSATVVPALILRLDDKNEYIRKKAAKSLSSLTDQYFGQDKTKWQDWWRENRDKEL